MYIKQYDVIAKIGGNIDDKLVSLAQIAIRGALGYSIMDVSRELYYYVFKPKRGRFRGIMLRKLHEIPKPYIITPLSVIDGNTIRFGLRILGNAIYYERQLADALARLEGRHLYNIPIESVERIECINEMRRLVTTIYDKSTGEFSSSDIIFAVSDKDIRDAALKYSRIVGENGYRVIITTVTPMLLLRNGINILKENRVKLSDIVAYAARRRSLLEYFYGSRRLYYTPEDVKSMMEFVDNNTKIHRSAFEEVDIKVKDKKGFCNGSIEFSFTTNDDRITKIIELLMLGRFIGVGKMTVFGFGQLTLSF